MARYDHDITTKDDVPLSELVDRAMTLVDHFNDATRPFRALFAENVSQQSWEQLPNDQEVAWGELAEGEHPDTVDIGGGKHIVMRTAKYGQALLMTQERIRKNNQDRILRRVQKMLEGYTRRETELIYETLHDGISDGTFDIWYDVDNYGEYTFTQQHNHWFEGTTAKEDLFNSTDNPWTAANAQPAHRFLEVMADHMRHHDRNGPYIALVGQRYARRLKDEMSWEANTIGGFDAPLVANLTQTSITEFDPVVDSVAIVQNPWVQGDKIYLTQAENGSPVKIYQERPVQYTGPNGAPIRSPGDFIGAYAEAQIGTKMVDPLAAVYGDFDDDDFQ